MHCLGCAALFGWLYLPAAAEAQPGTSPAAPPPESPPAEGSSKTPPVGDNTATPTTAPAAPIATAPPPGGTSKATTPPQPAGDTLATGTEISYGLTASLVRFNVQRPAAESGRNRSYAPNLEFFDPQKPPEFGFQFVLRPSGRPWRQARKDDTRGVQILSVGGILLVQFRDREKAQGSMSIAATLGFFDDRVSLGVGFDLYRGIPIGGPNGASGAFTAHTGLLSWAFARDGEMTPENVFVVLSFSLTTLGGGAQ
jgi:hypothetical protein